MLYMATLILVELTRWSTSSFSTVAVDLFTLFKVRCLCLSILMFFKKFQSIILDNYKIM